MTYSAVGGSYMLDAALSSITSGKSSMAVVSGSDSIINWQALDDIAKLGLLSDGEKGRHAKRMLPFSRAAVGALPGEGAASLILEREDNARARNAKIYGRIVKTRQYCSASDLLLPSKDGRETAEVLGHLLSSTEKGRSTLVNLNGMSAPAFDQAELLGLKIVINSHGNKGLLCSSSKHLFCHTFSASFTIDLAATVLAMENQFSFPLPVEPEVNGIDKAIFCTEAKDYSHDYGLVLGQGLGGNTGGVLVERV
jgi:3-oxoacyl-[acyl-carrier-protein] synthase II